MDAVQLWQTAQGELQVQMTRAMYDTWLRNTDAVSMDDGVLTVAVRNSFVKDWLENRLLDTVERAVASIVGQTFGAHHYEVLGHRRSWEGTAAMAALSLPAIFVTLLVLPGSALSPYGAPLTMGTALLLAAAGAGVATVAEGLSPAGTDNLTVPLATGAILLLLNR